MKAPARQGGALPPPPGSSWGAESIRRRSRAQGAVLVGILLGAIACFVIDRRHYYAAVTSLVAAVLSFVGLINAEVVGWNAAPPATIEIVLADHSRILAEHSRILTEHTRILKALPDTIRDKIGFKPPEKP